MKTLVLAMTGLVTASCSSPDGVDHATSIAAAEIVSSMKGPLGVGFVVQKTFTGGATGDTLFKVWSCRSGTADCALQAIIDTNDLPAPQLAMQGDQAEILVRETDAIWSFSNLSIDGGGGMVRVKLRYI